MTKPLRVLGIALLLAAALCLASPAQAAPSAREIDRQGDVALATLYATSPAARALSNDAKGILVFPEVVKGGFIVGGQYGVGVLRKGGMTAGYYKLVAASIGLQAGVEKFDYALFFTTEEGLRYLQKSDGWEVGVEPGITVVDEGVARSISSTTAREGIYAFFFSQSGLMAGVSLEGAKISPIEPEK